MYTPILTVASVGMLLMLKNPKDTETMEVEEKARQYYLKADEYKMKALELLYDTLLELGAIEEWE